jgi:hypothetical protein
MSVPASSKTTIDNLPASVSRQYAQNELAIKESPFFHDISKVSGQTSPQVAVLQPTKDSHLESLTGLLGRKSSLAVYTRPDADLSSSVFSYAVFPELTSKDAPLILDNLESLKKQETEHLVEPVQNAVKLLSQLNKMSSDVFTSCRILKRG